MRTMLPLPCDPEGFDQLARALFARHWGIVDLKRHGRSGQPQQGVDFYGQDEKGLWYGGQSKLRQAPFTLSMKDVSDEVALATTFTPRLTVFAIVTTARRDASLQRFERQITEEHRAAKLFRLVLYFWDDIADLLEQYSDIRAEFYGGIGTAESAAILKQLQATHHQLVRLEANWGHGQWHDQIDEASRLLKAGQRAEARLLLERMKRDHWPHLDSTERYRLLANLAHACEQEGDIRSAATLFLEAHSNLPGDQRARLREAIARFYLGELVEAYRLALQVRAEFPLFAEAYALVIRCAPPTESIESLENDVPRHLRTELSVAFALSVRSHQSNRREKALLYGKAAYSLSPDDPEIAGHLGIVLLAEPILNARADHDRFEPSKDNRNAVVESIDMLTRALTVSPACLLPRTRVDLLLARSRALYLLGNDPEGEQDVEAAYACLPQHEEAITRYAVLQYERRRVTAAIDLICTIAPVKRTMRMSVLLARLYAERNESEDATRALELLESCESTADDLPLDDILDLVDTFVGICYRAAQYGRAHQFLERTNTQKIPMAIHAAFRARIDLAHGAIDEAHGAINEGLVALPQEPLPFANILLARVCYSAGRFHDVVALYRKVLIPNRLDEDARRFLSAAQRAGEERAALEFCAQLRSTLLDEECVELELSILDQFNSSNEAITIIDALLQESLHDGFLRRLRLQRSLIGLRTNRLELLCLDRTALPDVQDVDGRVGLAVVTVLRHCDDPMIAIDYAYTLVRRHFESPDAHKAMLGAIGIGEHPPSLAIESDCVTVGSAVLFLEKDKVQAEWRVIEDLSDPTLERCELAPDHPVSQELLGKRVGEEFYLRRDEIQDRTATIQKIVPKYVFRWNDSLSGWEERFPGEFFCRSVNVADKVTGELDLAPIFRSVDLQIKHVRHVEALYAEYPVSVFAARGFLGGHVLSVMSHLAYNPDQAIRCCQCTSRDIDLVRAKLPIAKRIVLDASAIATLVLLDLFEPVLRASVRWAISEGTFLEVLQWVTELREPAAEGGFITKSDGRHAFVPHDATVISRQRQRLETLVEILREHVKIEPGTVLLKVSSEQRKELIKLLDQPSAESIALAHEPGVILWTDDLVAGELAIARAGVDRAWTQAVMSWLVQGGVLDATVGHIATLGLVASNYVHTYLSTEAFLLGAVKAKWDPDVAPLVQCIRWYATNSLNPEDLFRLTANTVKAIWDRSIVREQSTSVVWRLLDSLAKRSHGLRIISEVRSRVDAVYGINVVAALELSEVLDLWWRKCGLP